MGVESKLREQRKQERRHRKAEMPPTFTAKRLSKALAFAAVSQFIFTACGPNANPPEQFSMVFPPHLRERFDQTITTIPQHLIENINLAQCPPDISISNAQLASAVIKFDPSTGEVTFSIAPEQNVEGLVSVTAQLKAVGESGTCVVAGIATGSAEIDTKATNCTQTSFVQNTAQLVCDDPGTITADGATTPITNGNANVPILDTDGKTTAQVDDGHGNRSELDIAIGANCNVTGAINYQNNQYEVPFSCDNPATVTSDVNGSVTSVSGPNEVVNVPVRGGDGEHTAITATRNNFTTQVDFIAPIVNQPPPSIRCKYIYSRWKNHP